MLRILIAVADDIFAWSIWPETQCSVCPGTRCLLGRRMKSSVVSCRSLSQVFSMFSLVFSLCSLLSSFLCFFFSGLSGVFSFLLREKNDVAHF